MNKKRRKLFFSIKGKLVFFFGFVYLAFALSIAILNFISAKSSLVETVSIQMDNSLKGITTIIQTSINTAVKNYLRFNSENNYLQVLDIKEDNEELSKIKALKLIEEIQKNSRVNNYIIDA